MSSTQRMSSAYRPIGTHLNAVREWKDPGVNTVEGWLRLLGASLKKARAKDGTVSVESFRNCLNAMAKPRRASDQKLVVLEQAYEVIASEANLGSSRVDREQQKLTKDKVDFVLGEIDNAMKLAPKLDGTNHCPHDDVFQEEEAPAYKFGDQPLHERLIRSLILRDHTV